MCPCQCWNRSSDVRTWVTRVLPRVLLILSALQSSTIDIKLCIGALAVDEIAAQTKKERPGRPMDKKDEIVANVVWRFLDVRG